MNIKLYIGTELADFNEVFNVMYSIGDVRNIGFGNNNKTYTLNLPLTKTNKRLLKFINQSSVKSEVDKLGRLYLKELLIIQGSILVTEYTQYFAKIIINSDDWIDDRSNLQMKDLDLSAYNHYYTDGSILTSWSTSYPFYRYPMIDFGALVSGQTGVSANWLVNDFIPAISVSQLITEILKPYVISSTWLSSAYVKDLYILANEMIASDSFTSKKNLSLNIQNDSDNENLNTVLAGATNSTTITDLHASFKNLVTDEASAWTSYNNYIIPETGTYRFKAILKMWNDAYENADLTILNETYTLDLVQRRGGSDIAVLDTVTGDSYTGGELISGVTKTIDSGYCYFEAGDLLYVRVNMMCQVHNNSGSPVNFAVGLKATDSTLVNIWDNANKYSGVNKTIKLDEMLPDMTQSDFLAAIRDIFNLRFWIDKSKNTIYIEPWDQMLSPTVINISDYADFTNPDTYLISPNYYKNIALKWRDDSDAAYTEYLKTNTSPGQYNLTLNSLFAMPGIDVRENPFSSIITGYDQTISSPVLLPRIWNAVSATPPVVFDRLAGFNTRIVHWDGLTSGMTWYYNGAAKTTYPKVSPIDWSYLFDTYWMKFYHYIDQGKLYIIQMKLRPGMLSQFFMVLNNVNDEGFRATYKINIDGTDSYFFIQTITSDGESALCEFVLKQ